MRNKFWCKKKKSSQTRAFIRFLRHKILKSF